MSKLTNPSHRSAVLTWCTSLQAALCLHLARHWLFCSTANKPERGLPLGSVSAPPGGGPGPHYHEREDEWFYIVEGRVDFFLDGTWTELSPGDCVYSPRGSVHGFKNNTDQPIRVFININPSGIEHFFAEAAEEWAKPDRDMSRILSIAEKYGHHHLVDQ